MTDGNKGSHREHPILFSGPMVSAILGGRKTQTRRIIATPPRGAFVLLDHGQGNWPYASDNGTSALCNDGDEHPMSSPYGHPGDRLWVRETWQAWHCVDRERDSWEPCEGPPSTMPERYGPPTIEYKETGKSLGPWTPSIHMPRWASRIALEVTSLRVEQLHDISEDDAREEGLGLTGLIRPGRAVGCFSRLWDEINGKRAPWSSNPWVWVIGFRRVEEVARAA